MSDPGIPVITVAGRQWPLTAKPTASFGIWPGLRPEPLGRRIALAELQQGLGVFNGPAASGSGGSMKMGGHPNPPRVTSFVSVAPIQNQNPTSLGSGSISVPTPTPGTPQTALSVKTIPTSVFMRL